MMFGPSSPSKDDALQTLPSVDAMTASLPIPEIREVSSSQAFDSAVRNSDSEGRMPGDVSISEEPSENESEFSLFVMSEMAHQRMLREHSRSSTDGSDFRVTPDTTMASPLVEAPTSFKGVMMESDCPSFLASEHAPQLQPQLPEDQSDFNRVPYLQMSTDESSLVSSCESEHSDVLPDPANIMDHESVVVQVPNIKTEACNQEEVTTCSVLPKPEILDGNLSGLTEYFSADGSNTGNKQFNEWWSASTSSKEVKRNSASRSTTTTSKKLVNFWKRGLISNTKFCPGFCCRFCRRSFPSLKTLDDHVVSVHLHDLSALKTTWSLLYQGVVCKKCKLKYALCSYCGEEFYGKQSVRKHILEHRQTKYFQCTICAESFLRKSFRFHLLAHKHLRPACQLCTGVRKCRQMPSRDARHLRNPVLSREKDLQNFETAQPTWEPRSKQPRVVLERIDSLIDLKNGRFIIPSKSSQRLYETTRLKASFKEQKLDSRKICLDEQPLEAFDSTTDTVLDNSSCSVETSPCLNEADRQRETSKKQELYSMGIITGESIVVDEMTECAYSGTRLMKPPDEIINRPLGKNYVENLNEKLSAFSRNIASTEAENNTNEPLLDAMVNSHTVTNSGVCQSSHIAMLLDMGETKPFHGESSKCKTKLSEQSECYETGIITKTEICGADLASMNEDRFTCNICRSVIFGDISEHITCHITERDGKCFCNVCGTNFFQNFLKHMKLHIEGDAVETEEDVERSSLRVINVKSLSHDCKEHDCSKSISSCKADTSEILRA